MTPWREVWNDFRDAAARFSRPARLYIGAEFLLWTGHGIFSVLFNLALVEAGADERRVGQAIAAGDKSAETAARLAALEPRSSAGAAIATQPEANVRR